MTVSSLGYIGIESTNLEEWRHFATEVLGVMVNTKLGEDKLYLQIDDRAFRMVITPGNTDRFLFAGWELKDTAHYNSVIANLEAAGHHVERCGKDLADSRCVKELARTLDPDGNQLELYHGRVNDYDLFNSPQGVSGFVTGNMGMGHVVLPTPSLAKCHQFYTEILGFQETDYMDVELAPSAPTKGLHFLHCDNPRHHSLALFEIGHPAGLIHMMLEVKSLDDVGYALDRCKANSIHVTASLGRHTNDRMVSFYMRSPSGFEIEFGCDGWQVDWDNFVPTSSRLQSFWGHEFNFPEALS
ncbi:VOC family protein [Zhongshania borealis]|uniref:Biphenyl-2,3-diol 1,2-dioxygenase n=1 Tax=Zhongshania borealis TaxID=889488 RepID=A0ABP7X1K8_9GAMM